MQLIKLRLFQYRNIQEVELFPSAGTNLFSGRNGQGKTNLLESIYLLAYGKSFRTSTFKDCIQHGKSECRIEGTVQIGSLTRELKISISHEEKKLFVFGKTAALDEFVGNLHLLAFTNEHLSVVRGGPADRRAFLDRAMVSLYPGHISHLTNYVRSLKQRNKILSDLREGKKSWDEALLDSWDEALAKPGARILANRMRYVDLMKKQLTPGLFGDEILKIHYLSSIGSDGSDEFQFEEQFRKRLFQSRAYDQRTGFTSVGPHRDELKLYVNGKSLGDFGSAGQQRSSLLALYFAQMEIHKEMNGDYPLFLVDDAEAELDEQRLKTFLSYLSQKTQLFLTSAKDFLLPIMPENTRCFEVVRGNVATQQQ